MLHSAQKCDLVKCEARSIEQVKRTMKEQSKKVSQMSKELSLMAMQYCIQKI